jgi:uncharacterized protein involved in exopolysaccharide biosynthesis
VVEKFDIRQETTLRDFLNVIFRRKWVVLSVVALATITVFFLNARKPAFYGSTSRLLVKRGEQGDVLSGHVRYLTWAEEVSSQIEVILSESVFATARSLFADSVAARGLPKGWMFNTGGVRADVVGESNVFTVTYIDLNPTIAQLGCQVMTTSFQDYYRERRTPPALEDFFAEEIADVRSQLEHWETKRNEFLNQEKFFGMYEESRYLLTQIGIMEQRMIDLDSEVSVQITRVDNLAELKEMTGRDLEDALAIRLSRHFMQSGIIERIKFDLHSRSLRREEMLQKYTEKHPEVIAIDTQIRDLRIDLKGEVENAHRVESQELAALVTSKEQVARELTEAREKLNELPDKDMELNRYDTIIDNLKVKYELLLSRQSETDIALAGRAEWEVTILSNASAPYSRKTRDVVRLALGPFLSIVVALGLAFFLESMDHSVKNMAEAEEYLQTSVLATISEVHK